MTQKQEETRKRRLAEISKRRSEEAANEYRSAMYYASRMNKSGKIVYIDDYIEPTYKNERVFNIVKMAKYYHTSYAKIMQIMRDTGMGLSGALDAVLAADDEKMVVVRGEIYTSITYACNKFGVNKKTLNKFAKQNDLELDEALQLYLYLRDENESILLERDIM